MNINDFGFPFTSVGGDRQYGALEWRDYFNAFTISGIVTNQGNELKVNPQASPNKTVYVDTGAALIEGAMRIMPATTNLTIADNSSGNPRIDRIVARLNYTDRKIEFAVKQGTPAASPSAPTLTRNTTSWEISLAKIAVANGFTTIVAGNITDERADTTVCGAANFTLGVIPASGADAVTIMLGAAVATLYGLSGTDANVNKALELIKPLLCGASSLTANGYAKIGPLIIQWGSTTGIATFPIAFPNACHVVVGTNTMYAHATSGYETCVYSKSTTSVEFKNAAGSGFTEYYIAIGY